jgi:hypothetical protein
MAGKNTLLALSLAFASCEYHTPPALSVPMAEASPGVVPDNRDARPTVRFPARIAIARIAASGDGFKLEDSTTGEKPEHAAKVASLPGVAGVMALNRIALISHVESYRELDGEALKLGADILAVYRFDSSEDIQDVFVPLTVASLGLAPNHTHKTTTVATLMIRDARTGYIYGILEERGSSSGLTAGIDVSNASHRGARRSRAEAMDKLMEQVPGFWNGVLAKGR